MSFSFIFLPFAFLSLNLSWLSSYSSSRGFSLLWIQLRFVIIFGKHTSINSYEEYLIGLFSLWSSSEGLALSVLQPGFEEGLPGDKQNFPCVCEMKQRAPADLYLSLRTLLTNSLFFAKKKKSYSRYYICHLFGFWNSIKYTHFFIYFIHDKSESADSQLVWRKIIAPGRI